MNNYKNNEVAVINYPLMDPRIKPENYIKYFELESISVDPWSVPVYIHIPFCSSICKFCIYNREIPDREGTIVNDYVEALKKEIRMYGETSYAKSLKIGAVFIGGGTPTCLSTDQIRGLIGTLRECLPINGCEITMECNIANADEEKIKAMSELGVTRISTGVQTFNQKYRSMMSMKTAVEDICGWIEMVRRYPFQDISIDLLYGLPGQSEDEWLEDIKMGVSLPVDHFSIYKLTVFAYTRLYHELEQKLVPPLPDDDRIYRMYLAADSELRSRGFILQSSQEYCRKGKNARFWDLTYDGYGDNLSFGAFSFGFINGISYQNIPDPRNYIDAIQKGCLPVKMVSKKITYEQLMERSVILGFRRSVVEKNIFYEQYGKALKEVFGPILEEVISQGLVAESENEYRLTTQGEYVQGNISAKFMRTTFENISPIKKKMAISMHVAPEALNNTGKE